LHGKMMETKEFHCITIASIELAVFGEKVRENRLSSDLRHAFSNCAWTAKQTRLSRHRAKSHYPQYRTKGYVFDRCVLPILMRQVLLLEANLLSILEPRRARVSTPRADVQCTRTLSRFLSCCPSRPSLRHRQDPHSPNPKDP